MDTTTCELQQPSMQRALGVSWDTCSDSFSINVTPPGRDYTKRGVVSDELFMTQWAW